MPKTVCIIGAGQSGLAAIKSALEEGLSPYCVEKRDDLGGMWNRNYREDITGARAYKSLITNISKEASCFSDFPYPKEYPTFITCDQFHQYLKSYANHFRLMRYIKFNTEVINVEERIGNKLKGGLLRWAVTKRDVNSGDVKTNEFDCIIVCVGNKTAPLKPHFDGLYDGKFKGKVMHSLYYDTAEDLKGKRVLIIGLGNSAADIAADVSNVATHTSLSTRSGAWVVSRRYKNGLPQDVTVTTRFMQTLRSIFPKFLTRAVVEHMINSRINHDILGIRSRYNPLDNQVSVVINDDLPRLIVSGKVKIKTDVQKFEENHAFYVDGSSEHIDVVILATGLQWDTSCFSNDLIPDDYADMKFYLWIFPFEIAEPSSFAILGIRPQLGGSLLPVVELQSRYVAQVMSGRKRLPSVERMRSHFAKEREKCIIDSGAFHFRTPAGLDYTYEIADLCGVNPSFWRLLFRDPKLALAIYFGPLLSYNFRLIGRHTWDGARERILNVIENTVHGLRAQY